MTTEYEKQAKARGVNLEFPKELPNKYLECRVARHQYDLIHFGRIKDAPIEIKTGLHPDVIVKQMACGRCGTLKEAFYSARSFTRAEKLVPMKARYIYTDKYLFRQTAEYDATPDLYDYMRELYVRLNGALE